MPILEGALLFTFLCNFLPSLPFQVSKMMSCESMVSFLRQVAPGVEQALQQNETVDIFQVTRELERIHVSSMNER